MNNTKTILIVVAVLVIGFFGATFLGNKQNQAPDYSNQHVTLANTDWVSGSKTAPVMLTEYGDFQCPACGAYYPVVKALQQKYGNKLSLVFRQFPLVTVHKNAHISAQAAEAAGIQGKFFEMYDALYTNQSEWSDVADPAPFFTKYATALKLDVAKFTVDMNSDAVKAKIDKGSQDGITLGIDSTPSFFVNGNRIVNPQSAADFDKLIADALAAAGGSVTVATSTKTQ